MASRLKFDSGLQPAISSIVKNEKFKRLLVFGLRNVAEFCVPPNNNYIFNSLAVIDQNAFPIVCRTSNPNDEDVSALCIKVIWGVSEAIKKHPDMIDSSGMKYRDRAMAENIGDTLAMAISANIQTNDVGVLEFAFDALLNFYESDFALDVKAICPGIIKWLSDTRLAPALPATVHARKKEESKRDAMVKGIRTIKQVCSESKGVEGLLQNQGVLKLLDALVECPAWVVESPSMIKDALTATLAAMNHPNSGAVVDSPKAASKIADLMQRHRKHSKIEELGGLVLVRMLQPEQIKACLNALSSAAPGSAESIDALKLLSIMVYVDGVAETLTTTGGIGLLVEALKKSADLLPNSVSEDALEGIIGAIKMLGKVSGKAADHAGSVVKWGGVPVLIKTIEKASLAVGTHPKAVDVVAACCDACTILCREENNASHFYSNGSIATAFKTLEVVSSRGLALDAMELLVSVLGHSSIAKVAAKDADFLLRSVSKCASLAPDDASHQCNCITAIHVIAKALPQCGLVKSTGALTAAIDGLNRFASNSQVALVGAQLFESLSNLPDATTCLCDGSVADALFEVIVQQTNNQEIKDKAMNALNISIATNADVTRALEVLKKKLEAPSVDSFYRALVAMNGLSHISRLSPVFASSNALKELLSTLKKLIETREDIPDRASLIRCCLSAIGNAVTNVGDISGKSVVLQLLEHGQSASLKTVVDEQARRTTRKNTADSPNSLVDVLGCVCHIGKSGKIDQLSSIDVLVDTTTKIIRSFPDNRKVQVACLEVLAFLASISEGTAKLLSSGGMKLVVQNMQKTIMFEDVQVAGLRLWAATIKVGPREKNIDALKKAGAVDVLQAILLKHPNSATINAELPLIHSSLISAGALEGDLDAAMKQLAEATQNNDSASCTIAMQNIATITRTPDGVTTAIKSEAVKPVSACVTRLLVGEIGYEKKSPPELVHLSIASANVLINILTNKAGATALSKHCGVSQYSGILACLMADDSFQAKEATRESISTYLEFLANLMRQDKSFAESAYRKGVASKICKVVDRYSDDPSIVCDVFSVLGSFRVEDLAKTPEFDTLLGKLVLTFANRPPEDIVPKIVSLNGVSGFVTSTLGNKDAKNRAIVTDVVEKLVLAHQIVDGLGKVLEVHRPRKGDQDIALVKSAEVLISALSDLRNLKELCRKVMGEDVDKYARNIRLNKEDGDAAAISIKLMNQNVMKMNKTVVEGSAIIDTVQKIALEHPENRKLQLAANELLSSLVADDQVDQIMVQIIRLVESNVLSRGKNGSEDWPETLNELATKLYLFLGAEIKNMRVAFEHTKPCCGALMAAMDKQFNVKAQIALQNGALLLSVPAVTRKLGELFWEIEDSPYGAHAMVDSVFPTYTSLILTSSRCRRTRKFIIDGYRSLTACLANATVRPPVLRQLDSGIFEDLPKVSMDIMNGQYAADPEAVQRILEFLGYLAQDAAGAEILKNTAMPKGLKSFMNGIEGVMTRNQNTGSTVAAAVDLLGNVGSTFVGDLPKEFKDEKTVSRFERLSGGTPEGIAAMSRFQGKLLRNKEQQTQLIGGKTIKQPTDVIKRCIESQVNQRETMECTTLQKCDMTLSLAWLINSHVKNNRINELFQSGALQVLVGECGECIQNWEGEKEVVTTLQTVVKTLKNCALNDVDAKVAICKHSIPKLLKDFSGIVEHDLSSSIALLDLLNTLCTHDMGEANALLLNRTCPDLKNLLDSLEGVAAERKGDFEVAKLNVLVQRLREALNAEAPTEMLTLKKVLSIWNENESSILKTNSAVALQYLDFVLDKTEEYSRIRHTDPHSELGTEFVCGCLCLSLLHRNEEWGPILLDRGEHNFMFSALRTQNANEEHVCQAVVQTILHAIQNSPSLAFLWVTKCGGDVANSVVDSITRVHGLSHLSNIAKESLILQRLQIMEVVAQNNNGGDKCPVDHPRAARMFFNKTEALNILVTLLDDWIADQYSNQMLAQTMKTLRFIYNEEWIPRMIDRDVPRKLVDLLELSKDQKNPSIEWRILPDVLFLIGCIANNHNLKNDLGEMAAVESILQLLKLPMKHQLLRRQSTRQSIHRIESIENESSMLPNSLAVIQSAKKSKASESVVFDIKKVQMNACLALATLNIGHNNNIAKFGNNGGLDLNIELMQSAMVKSQVDDFDYDVANAAAVLICNSSYRRSDIQQIYGKKGACEAVMQTIKRYDGSPSVSATRCLTSMMKAIANLALLPGNVDIFLNHGIGETFEHICETSERLSDSVMAVCLRTLSNLVMEFTEDSMEIFSTSLKPILQMLRQRNRNDAVMLALAFDVLGALCRIPENARQFHELHGYAIVLEHLRTSAFEEHLNNFGLKLLVRQGRMFPESFPKMIEEGVFTFIISLVENPKVPPYVVTSALRLLLRIIQSSNDSANAFIQSGGLYSIFQRINNRGPLIETNEMLNPNKNEVTTTTLSCWIIATLLLIFTPDGKEDIPDQQILSPRSRKMRVSQVLPKPKFLTNDSPSHMSGQKTKETEIELGVETKDSELNGIQKLSFENVSEDLESMPNYEGSDERMDAAWKGLNINSSDLATVSKSICEAILDELDVTRELSTFSIMASQSGRSSMGLVDPDLLLASAGLIAYSAAQGLSDCIDAMFVGGVVELLQVLMQQIIERRVGDKDAVDLVRLCCMAVLALGTCASDSQSAELCAPESGLVEALGDCAKIMNSLIATKLLGIVFAKGVQGATVATDLALMSRQLLESGSRDEFKETVRQAPQVSPLLLTRYNKDTFPNGVQDIAMKNKEQLRKGGDVRVLLIQRREEDGEDNYHPISITSEIDEDIKWKIGRFQWRSSSDLLKFEWRIGGKGLYDQRRSITSIIYVQPGYTSAGLMIAAQTKISRLPRFSHCCVLTICNPGSTSSEKISILFRTSLACRRFIALITQWREAASSGMD